MKLFHCLRVSFGWLARISAAGTLIATITLAPSLHYPATLLADEENPPVFLFSWGSDVEGTGPGEFDDPHGIAVGTDDKVYVADTDNHRMQVFESNGTPILQYGTEGSGSGQFQYPEDVAVDDAGNMYVADTYNHRVVVLHVEGVTVSVAQQLGESNSSAIGQFSYPSGIAVTPDGATFYVADTYNHRIQMFTWDTDISAYVHADTWGGPSSGSGPKEFSDPEGIAVAADGNVYVADSGNSRIQKFTAGGVYSGGWGSSGSAVGDLMSPTGLAFDADGNVYVADSGNSRIQKFDASGAFLTMWGRQGSGDYRFNFARRVAITSEETILVADSGNHKVKAYRPASYYEEPPQYLASWGTYGDQNGDLAGPVSIAIDESGFVYVGNSGNDRVQKFTDGGDFRSTWGSAGEGADNVIGPNGIAVDAAGNVYVADGVNDRIHKLVWDETDVRYESVVRWGPPHDALFYSPAGVAVDSVGNVYVADQGQHQVQQYDPDSGEWTTFAGITGEWGADDDRFNHPYGIAVDGVRNWLYVSDYLNHRIKKYDLDGTLLATWGTYGQGAGEFDNPFGIAVDADGNVYVVDYTNHRVQKFDSEGGYLTQWGSEGDQAGQFSYPRDVAVHPNGSIYVCDTGNNRIQIFGDADSIQLSLKAGWNMVSVPVEPADASRAAVFPPAEVVAVYTWNPGSKSYEVPETIAPEVGYWVAVTENKTITVTGTPVTTWTDGLASGWNMCGSVYGDPVDVANLVDDPSGSILDGAVYWWNPTGKSYSTADQIEEGKGFWIASTQACDLTMTAPV